jgi:RNA polymerase sigma-70 factor (ECF subfamily)
MATTTLQANSEPIPIECYSRRVQELTDLITDHSPRFHRIAQVRLGNIADAEDAVQDALLSALTHVDQFRGQAKMSTWLTAIVINSARMKLRQRLTRAHEVLDKSISEQDFTPSGMVSGKRPGPEETYLQREIAEMLTRATSGLSPTLLKTLQLRNVHGLSVREAAHLLGVSSGTIRARTARARKKLKEFMQGSIRFGSPNQKGSSLRRISWKGGDDTVSRSARFVSGDSLEV